MGAFERGISRCAPHPVSRRRCEGHPGISERCKTPPKGKVSSPSENPVQDLRQPDPVSRSIQLCSRMVLIWWSSQNRSVSRPAMCLGQINFFGCRVSMSLLGRRQFDCGSCRDGRRLNCRNAAAANERNPRQVPGNRLSRLKIGSARVKSNNCLAMLREEK